ncbi:MAG TPA: formimidoylglutamate deiminase [Cyclobacteriaceae bacterium]
MNLRFSGILTSKGWLTPGYVTINNSGVIEKISDSPLQSEIDEQINGFALPGFRNSHSHAFQYAMAGITEQHKPGIQDNFWTWREAMYQVALTMNPEQMEKVATFLYAEMLRHGYTHVAEFHYIHHDKDGSQYDNPAELGERLIAAAATAGIKITLIPIFYQMGNFGQPPQERQRRFISQNYDAYMKLWEASQVAALNYKKASLGVGVHSLRAVRDDAIIRVTENYDPRYPFHLHVSEQLKEVEDCIAHLGVRPARWLLDNVQLDENFHLIHATHLDDTEVKGLAESGANVVLCPSTEGNLGDGIFRLLDFKIFGGKWSIGTDSHIGLNPFEELRMLDYRERLITHQRNVLNDKLFGDTGAYGFDKVLQSGRMAMGDSTTGYLDPGNALDAFVVEDSHPLLASNKPEFLLSTIIYTFDSSQMLGTMVDGKWAIRGQHPQYEKLSRDFLEAVKEMGIRNR